MIDTDGKIIEYKKYEDVLKDWFVIRKQLYEDRIDRHVLLYSLMIKYLENIIRFTKNHLKYNIRSNITRDKADKILEKNKYDTFNHTLLLNPKFSDMDKLKLCIINNIDMGTSYDYIINLRYSDLLEGACKRREKELEEYNYKLKNLLDDDGTDGIMKGGKTWLREIDQVESVIKDGISKGWDYGEDYARFKN